LPDVAAEAVAVGALRFDGCGWTAERIEDLLAVVAAAALGCSADVGDGLGVEAAVSCTEVLAVLALGA
jgi:hypothetical protein